MGHPAAGRLGDHRRGGRYRHGYQNATLTATLPAFTDEHGRHYPALGRVTIPYAAATQLVSPASAASSRRMISSERDVDAARLRRPRHARQRHDRPADQRRRRHRGRRVQRQADADESARQRVGSVVCRVRRTLQTGGTDADVARGIRYAADNGAKIINLSLGGSGPRNCATMPNQTDCAPVIEAAMRYAVGKGCFIAVAGGNEFEDNVPPYGTNPTSVIAEIASRFQGAVSVAAVDRGKGHALLFEHGQLHRAGGARRIRARLRRQRLRLAADVRLQLHRHVPAAAGAVHCAAVRRPRLRRLHRHVDGGAARRRRRRDAHAAGRHRPGGDRGCPREDRTRSRQRRAATTSSASGWSMRGRRCVGWASPGERVTGWAGVAPPPPSV